MHAKRDTGCVCVRLGRVGKYIVDFKATMIMLVNYV